MSISSATVTRLLIGAGLVSTWPSLAICQEDVKVVLEPREMRIRELDPLFLKVTTHYEGKDRLLLAYAPANVSAVIELEIKPQGEEKFTPVYTRYHGLIGSVDNKKGFALRSGQKFTSYELLFRFHDRPAIAAAGKYEVRATLIVGKSKIPSNTLCLEVTALDDQEKGLINKNGKLLEELTDFMAVPLGKAARLPQSYKIANAISPSKLKETLQAMEAIAMIMEAKDMNNKEAATKTLERLRKQMDTTAVETIDVFVARNYLVGKRWKEAADALSRFDDSDMYIQMLKRMVPVLDK